MGWFRTSEKPSTPVRDELWTQCPECKTLVYKQEWRANVKVCPKCNYHGRLSCYERVELLIDSDTFLLRDEEVMVSLSLIGVATAGFAAPRTYGVRAGYNW